MNHRYSLVAGVLVRSHWMKIKSCNLAWPFPWLINESGKSIKRWHLSENFFSGPRWATRSRIGNLWPSCTARNTSIFSEMHSPPKFLGECMCVDVGNAGPLNLRSSTFLGEEGDRITSEQPSHMCFVFRHRLAFPSYWKLSICLQREHRAHTLNSDMPRNPRMNR